MTPSENQIDILINYRSNFEQSIKDAQLKINELSKSITTSQNRFDEIAKSRTKSANAERRLLKDNLVALKEELSTYKQIVAKKSEANDFISKGVLTQRNALDTMIKDTEVYNKRASNIIKERLTKQATEEERSISKMLKEQQAITNSIITNNQARFNAEVAGNKRVVDDIVAVRKQEHAQTMKQWRLETDTRIKQRESELSSMKQYMVEKARIEDKQIESDTKRKDKRDADAKKAEARTWKGAWFGSDAGSTFGHKFLTTAQYAVAGTALYGAASAATALAQAALEADLNMRTMAAVLGLTINQAKELDKDVRKLGETYGGTTTEIEQVALALGRAGVETQDIAKATEITLKMARLTGDTFEQSANAVISFQQVFGNTTSLETLGNKLAYVANQSRLSTQDIGTLSNYALAAAKDVGLTEDAVGGLAAAFSNAGVNASTIGTQIRRFTTLLTDNSEAVTSFFNEAGVSQSKLALQISRGGKDSNEAMMKFATTLQNMDAQTFTKLTGQMDILAANSLALIRNNADNINTYMSDLQKGLSTQLDSVSLIVDATKVKIETLWNSISNSAINSINSTVEWFDLRIDGMYYSWLDLGMKMNKAGQEIFTLSLADTTDMDKRIAKNTDLYNITQLNLKLKAAERRNDQVEMISLQAKIKSEGIRLGIIKESTKVMDSNALRDNENIEGLKTRLEYLTKNKNTLSDVEKIELELVQTTIKSNDAKKKSVALDKEKEATLKGTFVSAKDSYEQSIKLATSELSLNKELTAGTKELYTNRKNAYNAELLETYNSKLKETSNFTKNLFNGVNFASVEAGTAIENISSKLREQINITQDADTKKMYADDLAVLSDMQKVHSNIMDIKREENNFDNKTNSINESTRKKAQEAADKALRIKEQEVNLGDRNEKALASIAELQAQLTGETELTLGKAESKFYIDTQLVGLAYEQYMAAKGTTQEKEKEVAFNEATVAYLKSSVNFVNKQVELEEKRKSLSIELNSSLTQAIEGEQVRLGIIEKSTDSEYEKLRVKIEQGKLDRTLVGNELVQAERRLAELKVLQSRKKDVHTLAMEYQRELQDQETMGYIAAKAGLASLESGMMNFFDVTSDGWLDWHNLASSVLTDIYKQLLQQLVIKQLVSGIAGGISAGFGSPTTISNSQASSAASLGIQGTDSSFTPFKLANGGMIPTKGYASGGILSGGTGIRDDIYLGNVSGTRVFAMGGEFITRKSSVNDETKGTLDYINKTGTTPSSSAQVNVPVKINIENNTGQNITADMIESMTKPNDKGEYEKVVSIILKASQTDPRVRSMLKGR